MRLTRTASKKRNNTSPIVWNSTWKTHVKLQSLQTTACLALEIHVAPTRTGNIQSLKICFGHMYWTLTNHIIYALHFLSISCDGPFSFFKPTICLDQGANITKAMQNLEDSNPSDRDTLLNSWLNTVKYRLNRLRKNVGMNEAPKESWSKNCVPMHADNAV